jgi:hypothetical protein
MRLREQEVTSSFCSRLHEPSVPSHHITRNNQHPPKPTSSPRPNLIQSHPQSPSHSHSHPSPQFSTPKPSLYPPVPPSLNPTARTLRPLMLGAAPRCIRKPKPAIQHNISYLRIFLRPYCCINHITLSSFTLQPHKNCLLLPAPGLPAPVTSRVRR